MIQDFPTIREHQEFFQPAPRENFAYGVSYALLVMDDLERFDPAAQVPLTDPLLHAIHETDHPTLALLAALALMRLPRRQQRSIVNRFVAMLNTDFTVDVLSSLTERNEQMGTVYVSEAMLAACASAPLEGEEPLKCSFNPDILATHLMLNDTPVLEPS